jgi:ectoine hydroxylase-related dioxygenase (phytanoyl-CoA dioxygenase family)
MPQILSPHTTHPKLLQTTYFQRATELARVLLGENAELRTSHMILKPAGSKRDTPWHQDQSYHSPKFFYKNVNFWLPLDGASVDDGCMWFVPRTHAGMVFPHEQVGGDATATVALNADYWHQNGVPVPLPRGSVSAHHSYCMHYAGPNRSLRPRRAWILVFATEPRPLEEALVLPWQAD